MNGRGLQRKATVELQRRPQRQGTIQLKPGMATQPKARSFADPKVIPGLIKNCYAPESFDEASSVIVCNFPTGYTAANARNFGAWFGPVVRVERAPSIAGESNFILVFSSSEHAEVLKDRNEIIFQEGKPPLYCRGVDPRPSLWKSITATIWG